MKTMNLIRPEVKTNYTIWKTHKPKLSSILEFYLKKTVCPIASKS